MRVRLFQTNFNCWSNLWPTTSYDRVRKRPLSFAPSPVEHDVDGPHIPVRVTSTPRALIQLLNSVIVRFRMNPLNAASASGFAGRLPAQVRT